MLAALAKPIRFLQIYGLRRTLYKVAARKRGALGWLRPRPAAARDIGVLGCGQFAFATIGCIVAKRAGNRFIDCFDPDGNAQATFADFYRVPAPAGSGAGVIANPAVKLVFVASNHASHTDYAVEALALGKDVYCEKPVSVTEEQAGRLFHAVRAAEAAGRGGHGGGGGAIIGPDFLQTEVAVWARNHLGADALAGFGGGDAPLRAPRFLIDAPEP